MAAPSNFYEDLRAALRGRSREAVMMVGASRWGRTHPILIAEGDAVHARYSRLDAIRMAQRHDCHQLVIGHGHPVDGLCQPSHGDLLECWQLSQHVKPWNIKLLDFVIVAKDGQLFSFLGRDLMDDPLGKGKPFAKEGVHLACQLGY